MRQWGGPGGVAPPGRSLSRGVWGAEPPTQGVRSVSPHQTSGLVSSKLGQSFGGRSGVDLGRFWGGLGVVEGGWVSIGWAEGWALNVPRDGLNCAAPK